MRRREGKAVVFRLRTSLFCGCLFFFGFLFLRSFVTNQQYLVEKEYEKVSNEVRKEKDSYWLLKSDLDKLVDQKIAETPEYKRKLRQINKRDVTKVVFK